MGWVAMIGLASATALGLGLFLRRDRAALQFLAAALLLALAGYSWQSRPDMAGAPKGPPVRQSLPESEFAKTREETLGRFDRAAAWLNMADSFQARGDYQSAAELLQGAARRNPRDVDLWVGFGNALVLQSGGMMTPASQLAFDRAQRLAPGHPAPRFFYGLALAQGGNIDGAEDVWRAQAAGELPPNYRALIEQRLGAIDAARAAGELPARGAAPAPAPAPAPAR